MPVTIGQNRPPLSGYLERRFFAQPRGSERFNRGRIVSRPHWIICFGLWLVCASPVISQQYNEWNFEVFLNDKKVGWHHFKLQTQNGTMRLTSTAAFDFNVFLFYPVKYRHRAVESWRDGCLTAIDSRTEKRGKSIAFVGEQSAGGLRIMQNGESRILSGCIRSFAYWNPVWLEQDTLLNGENGAYWPVSLNRNELPAGAELTLATPKGDILLRYDEQGDWQYLESKIKAVGVLSYRREVEEIAL